MERTYSVRRTSETPTDSTLHNLFKILAERKDLEPFGFFGQGDVEVLIKVGPSVVQSFGVGTLSNGAFYPIEDEATK